MDVSHGWLVEQAADDRTAYAVLSEDRIANGYALADLEPPFAPFTTVSLARRRDDPPTAACLILRGPEFTAIMTGGDPDGLAAIFASVPLPADASIAAQPAHLPAVERIYASRSRSERWRMALSGPSFRPLAAPRAVPARLGPADASALLDLYAGYDESFFAPGQLDGGIFYGVRDGGRLLAAGGTHLIAPRAGIAAVGNIFTRPEARGRGLAAAVTSAVVADLVALNVPDIILNVAVDNAPALAIYRRLGFRPHNRFWELDASLREPGPGDTRF